MPLWLNVAGVQPEVLWQSSHMLLVAEGVRRFTCRFGAIVAAEARTCNPCVIESSRRPSCRFMAVFASVARH